jgi:hypothetical protein
MTEPATPATPATPAPPAPAAAVPPIDPVVYDEPRNVRARIKGLPGAVIKGGDDPDPAEGLREERYYGRLLVAMVAALILGGFVIGLLIALAQA